MSFLKGSKKEIDKYDVNLSHEIIDSIPIINHNPELVAIDKKILKFQKLKPKKELELNQTSSLSGIEGTFVKYDSLADGQQLIDGEDIEALAGPSNESRRKAIVRQIRALEKATGFLQVQRGHLYPKLINEACKNLPLEVRDIFKDVIDRAEDLITAIQRAEKMDLILNKKGIETMRRDERFVLHNYFSNLLHCGPGGGLPSLPFILENQKKVWERCKDD